MSADEHEPTPAEVAAGLRQQAFAVTADQLGAPLPGGRNKTWALIMETGYPGGVASLVTFWDGTTSIYFSNGGGVIGGGEHAEIRETSKALLTAADNYLKNFDAVTEHPLPDVGRVRFYARTVEGLLSAEAAEKDLGEGRHALSPLFHAGHDVIGHLREISEQGK